MLLPSYIVVLSKPSHVRECSGWSLIEILAVLALVLLSGKLLLPNWAQGLSQAHLQQQHKSFLLHLRQSRATALSYQQPVSLCGWPGNTQCSEVASTKRQILSFIDTNKDGQWQADEKLLHRQSLHTALSLSFNRGAYVHFNATGTTGQSGSWLACWDNQIVGYKIVISSSGSLRSEQVTCDAQS